RAELRTAPRVLARLDLDEDEMITQGEVMGRLGGYFEAPPRIFDGGPHEAARGGLPFFSFSPGGPTAALVNGLLDRYDRDNNKKLSASEIKLPPALFRKLDRNRDGQLDASELVLWLAEPPDAELIVPLERHPRRRVEAVGPAAKLIRTRDGLSVLLDGWII